MAFGEKLPTQPAACVSSIELRITLAHSLTKRCKYLYNLPDRTFGRLMNEQIISDCSSFVNCIRVDYLYETAYATFYCRPFCNNLERGNSRCGAKFTGEPRVCRPFHARISRRIGLGQGHHLPSLSGQERCVSFGPPTRYDDGSYANCCGRRQHDHGCR